MTLMEILGYVAQLGVEAARDEAAKLGVTLSDELVVRGIGTLAAVFGRGPGVTTADELVVDDERK